jgi:hypothetical protein
MNKVNEASPAKDSERDLSDLLGCPFCGHKPNINDSDTLHPSSIFWVDDGEDGKHYFGRRHHRFDGTQNECWEINCVETSGGCAVRIIGDSKDDAIAKWQRRAT